MCVMSSLPKVPKVPKVPSALMAAVAAFGACCAFASSSQAQTVPKGSQCKIGDPVANNEWFRIMANFYNADGSVGCIAWDQGKNWNWFTVYSSNVKSAGRLPAGYPAVFQGCHYNHCSDRFYLRQLKTVSKAVSNWQISGLESPGRWNASYSIWFNREYNPAQMYPNGLELMIWEARHGDIRPAGKQVASGIRLNNRTYDKWVGNNNGTGIVTYVRTAGDISTSGFDLVPFFENCKKYDGLLPTWYLQSIQAGFEIWEGGQGLTTNLFEVKVD